MPAQGAKFSCRMQLMKKGDRILILLVLVAAGLGLLYLSFSGKSGARVIVRTDGIVTHEFSLQEDLDLWLTGYDGGSNRLVITNGKASITQADCPDKLCAHQPPIDEEGEIIVCLPHRITIEIESDSASSIDAVVR